MHKIRLMVIAVLLLSYAGVQSIYASNEKGHYVPGVEGIKAATLPPPGVYYRMYNVFYNSDALMDKDGDKLPINFDVSVYAMANRIIWITDKKFLGGYYGMDAIVPLIRTDLAIGPPANDSDTQFSVGDIFLEPITLSWHGARYDAAVGLGFYVPIGQYDVAKPASAGQDFWTTMLTFGATAYLDAAKSWSLSALGRYEINSEKSDTSVKPGQDLVVEWGFAKNVNKIWDLGLSGYCLWQLTDDSGSAVTWDAGVHDKVYAMGPEVSVFIMPAKAFLSVRSQWEFGTSDRSEGSVTTITFTKIF